MNEGRLAKGLVLASLLLAPISGGYVSTELQLAGDGFNVFAAFLGSADAPMLGFLLPSLLVLLAVVTIVSRRKVLQVPFPPVTMCYFVLGAILAGTVAMSSFRYLSVSSTIVWLAAMAPMIAVALALGRLQGGSSALTAISIGTAIVAGSGILEYASTTDPNWRVFANWVNPNAAAGMLGMGLFPAIALLFSGERLYKVVGAACALLIASTLFLTQSKGGLLAVGAAFVVTTVLSLWMSKGMRAKVLWPAALAIIVICGFGMSVGMRASSSARAGTEPGSALGRVASASQTQEQSSGFRRLLWQSSLELIRANPVGTGPGTFRYESTKAGLVSQTHHAHQGFLQLAVESGVLGLLAFIGLLLSVAKDSFRGATRLPPERFALWLGAVGSIATSIAHNFFDSDLQHFGTGFTLFAMLGIALVLAHDGTTPEFTPKTVRAAAGIGSLSLALALCLVAYLDTSKSITRGQLSTNDSRSEESVDSLLGWASFDADVWTLATRTAKSRSQALQAAEQAARLGPSMRNLRLLARLQFAEGQIDAAIVSLASALRKDPNNLPAMWLKVEFYDSAGRVEDAIAAATDLIKAETLQSFKIRAIPELVPTETFRARVYLAQHESEPLKKAELLLEAARGFAAYAQKTAPQVAIASSMEPPSDFAGETHSDAMKNIALGQACLRDLRALQGPVPVTEEELAELDGAFEVALTGFNRSTQ